MLSVYQSAYSPAVPGVVYQSAGDVEPYPYRLVRHIAEEKITQRDTDDIHNEKQTVGAIDDRSVLLHRLTNQSVVYYLLLFQLLLQQFHLLAHILKFNILIIHNGEVF
jgi:hypothetical protein